MIIIKSAQVLILVLIFLFANVLFFITKTSVASASDITGVYECAFDAEGNPTGTTFTVSDISGVITVQSGNYCAGEITIPQGVEVIDSNAFRQSGIERVVIPSSVRIIEEYAFFRTPYLASVVFSNGDIEIGEAAFSECTSLASINLRSGKKNIGEFAFRNSNSLVDFNFGFGIEEIGERAFVGTILETIKLPSSLKRIGAYAFNSMTSLNSIEFGGLEEVIGANSFEGSSITSLVIPGSVTTISYGAFQANRNLSSVVIPDGVLTIGGYAFYDNSALNSIDFGNTIQSIGEYAFRGSGLTNVDLPNSLLSIGSNAFSWNTSLSELRLGFGVQTIGNSAFASTDIRDLHIPGSITTIENDAFIYSSLENLSISESATGIEENAFTTYVTGPRYNANIHICQLEDLPDWGALNPTFSYLYARLIWVGKFTTHIDRNGIERLFYCGAPAAPKISNVNSIGTSSASVKILQSKYSGGSDISTIRISSADGSVSRDFPNLGNARYVIDGLKPGTNYTFKAFSINSKGVSEPSIVSSTITTLNVLSDAEERAKNREAERLRQQKIEKARTASVDKLKSGASLSLQELNESDFSAVNPSNLTRIQVQISKYLAVEEPSLNLISRAVNFVAVVDKIVNLELNQTPMYAQTLVDVGLISSSNKSKTFIWYLIKKAPASERRDEESVIALIGEFQRQIENRKNRLVELKARVAARQSQI